MKRAISIFILTLGIILSGCEKVDYTDGATDNREVRYSVICDPAGFDITYQNSNGGTEQKNINTTSWETSFPGYSGDFVYIAAQAKNENAEISVKIYYKGDVFKQASSSGDYVIAAADGTLP
jgi:hypothetical protein